MKTKKKRTATKGILNSNHDNSPRYCTRCGADLNAGHYAICEDAELL